MNLPGASKLVIQTIAGEVVPKGPGSFIENVGRIKGNRLEVFTDDPTTLRLVETGSFADFHKDEDSPLAFRARNIKLKEIYDVEMVDSNPESERFSRDIITHFGMKELASFAKKLKNAIPEVNGDLTIDEVEALTIKFMEENGSAPTLIYMKNSILIASQDDFELHLREVYKKHKKSLMMCGALFCKQPSRVVKASYTGRVRFA